MREAFDIDPRSIAPIVDLFDTYLLSRSMFALGDQTPKCELGADPNKDSCGQRATAEGGTVFAGPDTG